MGVTGFWEWIDSAQRAAGNTTAAPAWLTGQLQNQPIEFIEEFHEELQRAFARAYDARLWAAATVMMGFCSDDKFTDLRGWLIAQGRRVFDQVLEDPERLADLDGSDGDEGRPVLFRMRYVAIDAYRKKLKDDLADLPRTKYKPVLLNESLWAEYRNNPQKLFPRLASKYQR